MEQKIDNAEITIWLKRLNEDDPEAKRKVYELLYQELKKTAHGIRRDRKEIQTLNTTALVHESYLRLKPQNVDWDNRLHFYYIAGKVMRQVMCGYLEKKNAIKRGGNKVMVPIENIEEFVKLDDRSFLEMLCLENVLSKLEAENEVYGKIVECRFFSGLTIEETSKVLNVSEATVKRKWNFAKAWLFEEIKRQAHP